MDLVLRTLREGRVDPCSPAPLLLFRDSLAVVGGAALLCHVRFKQLCRVVVLALTGRLLAASKQMLAVQKSTSALPCPVPQAVHELAAAIAGSRAAAGALTIVAMQHPVWRYQQLCSLLPAAKLPHLTIIDGFSDPYDWGSLAPGSAEAGTNGGCSVVLLHGVLANPHGLQQLQQQLLCDSGGGSGGEGGQPWQPQQQQTLFVFDSLSPLLDAFAPTAVAQLLSRLTAQPGTAGVLCGLHADLHLPAVPAVVEQLSAGSLLLLPASDLERSVCAASCGQEPQGRVEARLRRRAGRVRAESQLYHIDARGAAAFLEPPEDVRNPAAAAERAAAAAAAAGGPWGRSTGWSKWACPDRGQPSCSCGLRLPGVLGARGGR